LSTSGGTDMSRATKVISEDIFFGEGPRWHEGRLWFSDFYAQAVKSISPQGEQRVEFEIDDRPSGLGWLPDGSLLVVSMTKRQVLRRGVDGSMSVHADLNDIATFHCNDMVVDVNGNAYVGNFGFDLDAHIHERGIPEVLADHPTAKLAKIDPNGKVTVASDNMHFPNGSVITPDGKTLIVGETLGLCLTAFDIAPNGDLSGRREWAPLGGRVPDGIALDAEGAVWVANPLAPECFRVAEGGEVLEVISTGDQPCYACMLGGSDGKSLFMLTAATSDAAEAAKAKTGKLLVSSVDVPHAGRP